MYFAEQSSYCVEYGQHRHLTAAYGVNETLQRHVGLYVSKLRINDALKTHQRQCCVIRMVSYQFSFTSKTHAVDAVRFENVYGKEGENAHHHKRYEHSVASREFRDEEYSR